MEIQGVEFNEDLYDILIELRTQLELNDIHLLHTIKSIGSDVSVTCPFHSEGQERKPSAGIRKSDGVFHCFACNEVHSLPEVVSHCFGKDMTGMFGWNWLLKNFATVEIESRKPIELNYTRTSPQSMQKTEYVSEEELDSYRYYHPYWAKRKITDERIIELFDLGVDLKTREITIPNFDKDGNCIFVARRSIDYKRFSYPSGVQKPVFGIYQLYQLPEFPKQVYITESMIDCIYLWQFNKYACALNGLGTTQQFKDLRNMPCRMFILATDNDSAGLKSRKRLRYELKNKLIKEVVFPDGRKDINDCTPDEILHLKEIF